MELQTKDGVVTVHSAENHAVAIRLNESGAEIIADSDNARQIAFCILRCAQFADGFPMQCYTVHTADTCEGAY